MPHIERTFERLRKSEKRCVVILSCEILLYTTALFCEIPIGPKNENWGAVDGNQVFRAGICYIASTRRIHAYCEANIDGKLYIGIMIMKNKKGVVAKLSLSSRTAGIRYHAITIFIGKITKITRWPRTWRSTLQGIKAGMKETKIFQNQCGLWIERESDCSAGHLTAFFGAAEN